MSVNWLNKSYGVVNLSGTKPVNQDPHARADQSLLAAQLDTRVATLAVEQQTLRTTGTLTQDALRKAIQQVEETASQIFSRLDQLERALAGDPSVTPAFAPKYLSATLSANQTANLANGNHIEFDTAGANSGHIALSTGAGQASGIFTLPTGVWKIDVHIHAGYAAASGFIIARLLDDPGNAQIGGPQAVVARPRTSAINDSLSTSASYIVSSAASVGVKVNLMNSVNLTTILGGDTHITIAALA